MAAGDIIAGDQVAGCSKSVEDFDLTLVAREPQTRANRAEHRTETRDKETGVGLPWLFEIEAAATTTAVL